MGFLGGMFSAVIKTVLIPVAVAKDAINVVTGEEPNTTKDMLASAAEDVKEATSDLGDGEFL